MKKNIFVILCCFLLLLSGCDRNKKYKRIEVANDFLEQELKNHVGQDTKVVNMTQETFPTQLPIYKITERKITKQEFQQVLELPHPPADQHSEGLKLEGNKISGRYESYTSDGYCSKTDEELEELAWETLKKLPFLDGKYECTGVSSRMTISDAQGEHCTQATVSFRRLLDGFPVTGNERCEFTFNHHGLIGVHIVLFIYQKIGTMELVPLEDAQARIMKPDAFHVDSFEMGTVNLASMLQVDSTKLLLANHYSDGCTILQPIYRFAGTATLADGSQPGFSSTVIAIPESYTQ